MAKRISFSKYLSTPVELKGGINENVSSLELMPGELISCSNYMIAAGGYGGYISTAGYEAIDGTVIPSRFESYLLTVDNCTAAVFKDDILTGSTTGAIAIALGDYKLISGSLSLGTARIEVEALKGTLTLAAGEEVTITGTTVGTITYPAIMYGGNVNNHLGLDYARTLVIEVPGEGEILGTAIFEGSVYVFRKKVGIAEVGLYTESPTLGWVELDTSAAVLLYSEGKHNFSYSTYNFGYAADSFSMYWVDGVNKCRAFDGTAVTVISNTSKTGTDAPELIATHNQMLFLTYPGGYLMGNGTPGLPNDWTAPIEYGLGHNITNLIAGVASSLIIVMDEGVQVLSGTSELDFDMQVYSTQSGGFLRSAQRLLGTIFFVDDRGLTTMDAVDAYGDYSSNSVSQKFKNTLMSTSRKLTCTSVSRDLNQYRIHFDDGLSIYVSFEGKDQQGATFIRFPDPVHNVAMGEDKEGRAISIFSTPGSAYIYKMDSGPSFNGAAITATLKTAFYHFGTPRSYKAFKRLTAEIRGEVNQEFLMRGNLDYSEIGVAQNIWNLLATKSTVSENSSIYGSAIYGSFIWGAGAVTNRVVAYLIGIGTNIGFNMVSKEEYRAQHIIQNLIVDYEILNRST